MAGNIVDNSAVTFNRSDAVLFARAISGTGTVTKAGAGTVNLTGASTYTGDTTVIAGLLAVNGSLGATHVTVDAGATLGGSGTINGLTVLESGSHLAPGNSPGTLTFTGGLTLADGAILDFQLGSVSDLLRVNGGVLTGPAGFGGITLNLFNAGGFDPLAGGDFVLFDFTGATLQNLDASDFTFGTLLAGTDRSDYAFALTGNELELVVTGTRDTGPHIPPGGPTVPDTGIPLGLLAVVVVTMAGVRRKWSVVRQF